MAHAITPPPDRRGKGAHLWAIVLAGGEGVRLRSLAKRVCGDERPKQYVPLLGSRTLLRQTLDRIAKLIPPERTVVVSAASHWRFLAAETAARNPPHLLVQPDNRGTAAGILFPAHWIRCADPEATVVVFPSDHFVLEEDGFMEHIARQADAVRARPDRMVLFAAQPSGPEVDYGWIQRGAAIGGPGSGGLHRVAAFQEKPSRAEAEQLLRQGCLWNTFIFVAGLQTLLGAAEAALPEISARLARIGSFAGTEHEAFAVRQAYSLMPAASFSRAILEPCPPFLAASELPAITWSDLGTPRRVFDLCQALRLTPPWLLQSALSA